MTDPNDEFAEFYRQRRRARLGTMLITSIALGLTALGIRAMPSPEPVVTPVEITPNPPRKLVFGSKTTPGSQPPAADTAEAWDWDEEEAALAAAINDIRRSGAACGVHGEFGPLPALDRSPDLDDAAFAQAEWLQETGIRAHDTPGSPHGQTPMMRAERQGFAGSEVGENLAWNSGRAEAVAEWWLGSDEHCRVLMQPGSALGIGAVDGTWVMMIGR